ncbi:DUF2189 domain-containing protein [Roseomonas sp. OT10]|uniref:DUF2189 domain-containing protein n=1 Tax=Roseomonas cutis TaxID=2897332 RepID=UPI001E56AD8F|nr:DUF2189 domain-containing protein [Roseomonas sp. OT10]UFN49741.1 DUF2189 domain-containing protein [Roseomonas sp. OT10]
MASVWTMDRMADPAAPAIRRIGNRDVWAALAQGWQDFRETPTQLVFLALLYPILGLVLARATYSGALMPLLWPLVSGFALLGPVAALGIYELSRRREQGLPTSWANALDVLRSPAMPSILALAVLLLALFVAWLGTARLIYDATVGGFAPASLGGFLRHVFESPQGWHLLLVGNATGAAFALVVLTLTVVSFPMLLDRNPGAGAAVLTSMRAVMANPGPMLLWGIIVGALLVLGSIPLFVGLAVVLPVLGHATWHLYRRMVAS